MPVPINITLDFASAPEAHDMVHRLGPEARQYKVGLLTVHASAGCAVLRAAVAAARPFPRLKVLALTVITSLSDADLPELGLAPSVKAQLVRLAALAIQCGCHGVVASAQEAAYLSACLPLSTLVVCPGIQLPQALATDPVRFATPEVAAQGGASHIVIGRAITAAHEPVAAFRAALPGQGAGPAHPVQYH